jgi:hypothetical protein
MPKPERHPTRRQVLCTGAAASAVAVAGPTLAAVGTPDAEIFAFWPEAEAAMRDLTEWSARRDGDETDPLVERAWEAALDRMDEIAERLCAIQCRTLDGMRLKARFSVMNEEYDGHSPLARSIVADLLGEAP